MKIALTHDHLFQIGGAEHVLFELHKIFPESPVYTLIHNPEKSGLFKISILNLHSCKRCHFPNGILNGTWGLCRLLGNSLTFLLTI